MSLLTATPEEVVLSLINQQNTLPVPVTQDNLYFGTPRFDTDGVTTILPTTAKLGGEYEGYATFKYQRINLSTAYDTRPILSTVGADTLYEMLPLVNQFLGLQLTTQDVVDTNVANVTGGEQVNINVQALPGSIGYTGAFIIRFFRQFVQLVDALKNLQLGVLSYPIKPIDGKRSIAMMMWDHDFSLDLAALKVANHYWVNIPAVQELMTDFGISDFPAPQVNGVTDYATQNFPGANTNFQRVTVQTGVVGSDYEGNALFHYNLS